MTPYLVTYMSSDLKERYFENRNRCIMSFLNNGFEGKILVASNLTRPEWPKIRYVFKAYSIREAISHGARFVIWADCPMVLLKPYKYLESMIKENGVLFPKNGRRDIWWSAGQWSSDAILKYFNMTRDEAFTIPLIVSGFMGFDVYSGLSEAIINDFFIASNIKDLGEGPRYAPGQAIALQNRAFLGVRPDQCVMSILAHKYKAPLIEDIYSDPCNAVCLPCDMGVTDKTIAAWYKKGEYNGTSGTA
jgi:hypothetical protein